MLPKGQNTSFGIDYQILTCLPFWECQVLQECYVVLMLQVASHTPPSIEAIHVSVCTKYSKWEISVNCIHCSDVTYEYTGEPARNSDILFDACQSHTVGPVTHSQLPLHTTASPFMGGAKNLTLNPVNLLIATGAKGVRFLGNH